MGGVSLRLAGLHRLPPKLQRDELQLRAGVNARRLAPLVHRTALSDSQIPVRDSKAHHPDRVPATLRVSPGGAVPAALSAREDTMHARDWSGFLRDAAGR